MVIVFRLILLLVYGLVKANNSNVFICVFSDKGYNLYMKTRVRAIIRKDRSILLVHRTKADEEYWVFPGGGVEETDEDEFAALRRECREELGVEVVVDSLFFESELHAGKEKQFERFYECHIIGGELGSGNGPEYRRDGNYVGEYHLEWVALDDFERMDIRPEIVRQKIQIANNS